MVKKINRKQEFNHFVALVHSFINEQRSKSIKCFNFNDIIIKEKMLKRHRIQGYRSIRARIHFTALYNPKNYSYSILMPINQFL